MTRSVSETSLVSVPSIQMNNSQIVLHDEDDDTVLDIEEYCSNREVVNLENAAVNIDNSNDVIIGPVTQFNVNGNVTIYSNGNTPLEATNEVTISEHQQHNNNFTNQDKNWNDVIYYWLHIFYLNKELIRNIAILLTIILISLVVTLTLITKTEQEDDDYDRNYTDPIYGNILGDHRIYYRTDWGGKPPKSDIRFLDHPIKLVIISHSSTATCYETEICFQLVSEIQKNHFLKPIRSNDIGYNFLIGGDGNIFVGRGWDVQNFHRKISIGISFIGNFNYDDITDNMLQAAQELINQGVELKKLEENYVLVGENQTNPKMIVSPGENVYRIISTWPHFSNKTML